MAKPRIGLEHGTVRLVPYSPEWKALFNEEKHLLESILGDMVVGIEHIGSTAIPDMPSKPIIDIAVAVRGKEDIPRCVELLTTKGYAYKGEYGLPGRHFFIKGTLHTHHLHVVAQGCHHWDLWLLFRNYMREHGELASQYSALKRAMAEKFASDRDSYTKSKGAFIGKTLEGAMTNSKSDRMDSD